MTAVYRLYTEDRPNLLTLVARYFDGASLFHVDGIWHGAREAGAVIEIVDTVEGIHGPINALQLAEDICRENGQSSVIITRQTTDTLDTHTVTLESLVRR